MFNKGWNNLLPAVTSFQLWVTAETDQVIHLAGEVIQLTESLTGCCYRNSTNLSERSLAAATTRWRHGAGIVEIGGSFLWAAGLCSLLLIIQTAAFPQSEKLQRLLLESWAGVVLCSSCCPQPVVLLLVLLGELLLLVGREQVPPWGSGRKSLLAVWEISAPTTQQPLSAGLGITDLQTCPFFLYRVVLTVRR